MPRPGLRVRSLRKMKIKLPGGASIIHYFKRRPSQAVCANCKKPLHGVPRERDVDLGKLSRRQKRPERPYGGNLCATCARAKIKSRLR
ncbi:MAG: 50S ribosomal protein L34e [Candidatus Aenigmarchaeota archaeon]|nr:50S ribosomal protein L34e [Candidatus Aenigmarchaeota archaeon]